MSGSTSHTPKSAAKRRDSKRPAPPTSLRERAVVSRLRHKREQQALELALEMMLERQTLKRLYSDVRLRVVPLDEQLKTTVESVAEEQAQNLEFKHAHGHAHTPVSYLSSKRRKMTQLATDRLDQVRRPVVSRVGQHHLHHHQQQLQQHDTHKRRRQQQQQKRQRRRSPDSPSIHGRTSGASSSDESVGVRAERERVLADDSPPPASGASSRASASTAKRVPRGAERSERERVEARRIHPRVFRHNEEIETFADLPGVKEAPVFRPTEDEWPDNPMDFIKRIRHIVRDTGICRVVPPESWRRRQRAIYESLIKKETHNVKTTVQQIFRLQSRIAASDQFVAELRQFLDVVDGELGDVPIIDGVPVDVFQLFCAVMDRDGHETVTAQRLWRAVGDEIGIPPDPITRERKKCTAVILRRFYTRAMSEYEAFIRSRERDHPMYQRMHALYTDKINKALESSDPVCYPMGCIFDSATELIKATHFGYHDGVDLTMQMLKVHADLVKANYFRMNTPIDHDERPTPKRMLKSAKDAQYTPKLTFADIEEAYWRIVETGEQPVCALYGSDLDVAEFGSGFPLGSEKRKYTQLMSRLHRRKGEHLNNNSEDEFAHTNLIVDEEVNNMHVSWNANDFAYSPGSVLRHLGQDIPGITRPFMYVGMLFASFCWHAEDLSLYAMNFLHEGQAKLWYGVPASGAEQLRYTIQKLYPSLFDVQPDLLFHLVTQVHPSVLVANGVPVYRTLQHAGEYIFTFPDAFHAGFNTGFNVAESCNFATPDWLEFGMIESERYRSAKRSSTFSLDLLLCNLATSMKEEPDYELAKHLLKPFEKTVYEQGTLRRRHRVRGIRTAPNEVADELRRRLAGDDGVVCDTCGFDLTLAAVVCSNSHDDECEAAVSHRAVCLRHVEQLCECSYASRRLVEFVKLKDLRRWLEWVRDVYESRSDSESEAENDDLIERALAEQRDREAGRELDLPDSSTSLASVRQRSSLSKSSSKTLSSSSSKRSRASVFADLSKGNDDEDDDDDDDDSVYYDDDADDKSESVSTSRSKSTDGDFSIRLTRAAVTQLIPRARSKRTIKRVFLESDDSSESDEDSRRSRRTRNDRRNSHTEKGESKEKSLEVEENDDEEEVVEEEEEESDVDEETRVENEIVSAVQETLVGGTPAKVTKSSAEYFEHLPSSPSSPSRRRSSRRAQATVKSEKSRGSPRVIVAPHPTSRGPSRTRRSLHRRASSVALDDDDDDDDDDKVKMEDDEERRKNVIVNVGDEDEPSSDGVQVLFHVFPKRRRSTRLRK